MRIEKPERVGWEITRLCNLTCPHCYSAATKRPMNELNTAESLEIIKSMKELGVESIGWTGGEPLLREDLEELIAYAAKLGIKSAITTNGVMLDEKRAKSLKKVGVKVMQISIDGSTPEWNYRMRRATSDEFNKALAAVRICRQLGYSVAMAMLIGEENLDDALEYIKLAEKEGVDCVRFCGFVPFGRGKSQNHRLGFTERKPDLKKFISKYYGHEKPMIAFDPAFGPPPPYYYFHECVAGKSMFYLTCTGDIFPCTSLLGKENLVGNVRKRSLADIWNDPRMTAVSNLKPQDIHGVCRSCRHLSHCHGACRGISKCHTGDLYASFPLCLYRVKSKSKGASHSK
jgi:radical SAM protein with 4Fe4S-binding SPASM domain